MGTNPFVGYVGPPELHDGCIISTEQSGSVVTIRVRAYDGQLITLEFAEVTQFNAVQAEEMTLYGLVELAEKLPARRFLFHNWDEESKARLEIVAQDLQFTIKPKCDRQQPNQSLHPTPDPSHPLP
ncbi:MAG: hypothetical protein JO316_25405 [Abitibacteriaceae bacterium]|nr:hypothetical protein [Abditibacteriaceae bacterium]MBV9868708.1 hypothetical protein [Abditibacteriaceae bacterium]